MSAISDQWTGNGLTDGTGITSGNVATAGNITGSSVTWTSGGAGGTSTFVTAADGFDITSSTTTDVTRLDTLYAATPGVRMQVVFTPGSSMTSTTEMINVRTSSTICHLRYDGAARTLILRDQANATDLGISPAVADGDELLIDWVAAMHTSPTTSNGRLFYRILNRTNTSWNGTGEHFYDSGYARNLQTTNPTISRFGKLSSGSTMPNGARWEFCGVEGITVNTADTSEAAAKAYFADDPDPAPPTTVPNLRTVQAVQRLA
jgi:hypothetical protein